MVLFQSWSPYWILIYLTSYLAAVVLAILFKVLFLDRLLKKNPSGLLSILVAGSIGAVKNLIVGALSVAVGLIDDLQLGFRGLGGFLVGTLLFLLFSVTIGARVEHGIIVSELNRVQAWLIGLRNDSAAKLADARETLATQTREALLPKVQSLKLLLDATGASTDTIESLRKVIAKNVRPLSEELNDRAAALSVAPESKPVRLRSAKFFQGKVPLRKLIRPLPTLAIMPVGNLLFGYMLFTAPECLDVFYATVVSVVFLTIFKLLIPSSMRVTRGKATLILSIVAVLCGVPPFLAGLRYTNDPTVLAVLLIVFGQALVTVLAFAYTVSLDDDRQEARTRLARVNQDLRLELSLFDQQLWLARRQWQFVVHGTVQAALTAALTRLQSGQQVDEATLELVGQDLRRAERALMSPPAHEIDLPGAFAEMQTTWRGICDIRFNITERASRALQGNNDACMCVNEIVKEAVSNAVRHGQAKTVTVEIDRETEQSLSLKVSNDGLPIKIRPAAGVGSKLIKELTTKWSLGSNKSTGLTVLAASLPLAK